MLIDEDIVDWIRATDNDAIERLIRSLTSSATTTATMRVVDSIRFALAKGDDVKWQRSMGKTIHALLRRATDLHTAIFSSQPSPRQSYSLLIAGWRDGANGIPARQPHAQSACYARGHQEGSRALREASIRFAGEADLDLSALAIELQLV